MDIILSLLIVGVFGYLWSMNDEIPENDPDSYPWIEGGDE